MRWVDHIMDQGKVPEVGSRAIDFELPDEIGRPVRLSEVWERGPVLLLFYPTDFGMHCSLQMGQIRDSYDRFEGLGVTILGISTNTVRSHGTWQSNLRLPFHLVSDLDGKVAMSYGMMCPEDSWLKGRSCRSAFLVGTKGVVLYAWVPPDQSYTPDVDALLEAIRQALTT
jgi:peroxiredoxin Q/BCP